MFHEGQLVSELKELNNYLKERRSAGGSTAHRRELAMRKGDFIPLSTLRKKEISSLFRGRSLVGVDGSLATYGASYPYTVTFFRALAHITSSQDEGQKVWTQEILSPLLPKYREKIEKYLEEGQGHDEVMAHLRWKMLATLEAEVALEAMRSDPRLLLLDGGFARLRTHAPEIWTQLKAGSLQKGLFLLGITEEIATSSLVQKIIPKGEQGGIGVIGDREFLFGILESGEIYRLHGEESGEEGRLYARFAGHPQVVAVDYLQEQSDDLGPALNFLYTITPSHGRGFPMWLDVVDEEVRLAKEEVEAMISTSLAPDLAEVFLRPLRASRDL